MTKPVVLITGAGGFIGGWIAEAFHLSGWADVRAGISRWSSAARIARFPVEIVRCDVLNAESLDQALRGVDYVVHCARAKGNDNSVTLSGTRLLLDRVKAAGVKKLVFMSSVAVYGEGGGVVEEESPLIGPMTIYGQGKRDAEAICAEYADETLSIPVIRPTLVYGPFSEQWTTPFITRFASGKWGALGPLGEGKCNLVYVGDLVRLTKFLLENDVGPFQVFNGNGPEICTWNSYLERFNAALGFPPLAAPSGNLGLRVALRRPVRALGKYMITHHRDLVMGIANRNMAIKRALKDTEQNLKIHPNDDEMQRFALDVTYSMKKAESFGFKPQTGVDEGIAKSAEWARGIGLVA